MVRVFSLIFVVFSLFSPFAEAGFLVRKGKFIQRDKFATMPMEDHYAVAMQAYQSGDYKTAIHHFSIVSACFPDTEEASESHYLAALSYWERQEYDFANEQFTEYLKVTPHSSRFMEIIERKFSIAEAFRHGARRRIMQQKTFPKWMRDPGLAVQIYDEIIAALPNHPKTVVCLYHKGLLLHEMHDFYDSIDSFQTLVRRFPKSEYAPESFLQMMKVYLTQSEYERQNSDIIVLAEMEIDKFRQMFPRDDRITQAEQDLIAIKETYARGLYEIGLFYERKSNPEASALYYRSAVDQFPNTMVAQQCRYRLDRLPPF